MTVEIVDILGDTGVPAFGAFQFLTERKLEFHLRIIEADDASALAVDLLHPSHPDDIESRNRR